MPGAGAVHHIIPGRVKYRARAAGMRMMISQTPIFTIHAELGDIRHFGQDARTASAA